MKTMKINQNNGRIHDTMNYNELECLDKNRNTKLEWTSSKEVRGNEERIYICSAVENRQSGTKCSNLVGVQTPGGWRGRDTCVRYI